MWNIEYSEKAKQFLKKQDKHIASRILGRIENLKEDAVPADSKFVGRERGEKVYRYRVGDYRVLYMVKDQQRVVLIIKIDKRGRVYD